MGKKTKLNLKTIFCSKDYHQHDWWHRPSNSKHINRLLAISKDQPGQERLGPQGVLHELMKHLVVKHRKSTLDVCFCVCPHTIPCASFTPNMSSYICTKIHHSRYEISEAACYPSTVLTLPIITIIAVHFLLSFLVFFILREVLWQDTTNKNLTLTNSAIYRMVLIYNVTDTVNVLFGNCRASLLLYCVGILCISGTYCFWPHACDYILWKTWNLERKLCNIFCHNTRTERMKWYKSFK